MFFTTQFRGEAQRGAEGTLQDWRIFFKILSSQLVFLFSRLEAACMTLVKMLGLSFDSVPHVLYPGYFGLKVRKLLSIWQPAGGAWREGTSNNVPVYEGDAVSTIRGENWYDVIQLKVGSSLHLSNSLHSLPCSTISVLRSHPEIVVSNNCNRNFWKKIYNFMLLFFRLSSPQYAERYSDMAGRTVQPSEFFFTAIM